MAQVGRGCGPTTINHYVRAARGFFRWLVKAKRLGSNPLEYLTLLNTTTDVRRARRELTVEELRLLFAISRASNTTFRGLTGEDRYALYLAAAGTGFRANSLANLTPAVFDFNALTVTLSARFAKNRKTKVQPLPADVADALRDYLDGKPANTPIWGGRWASDHKGAEMLRIDLKAAGIAYAVEGPDGPEYADFHSLRHSYLTLGGRSGIDLRTLQELAGHWKPELTARYCHRRLYDLSGAVGKLPNLVPSLPEQAEITGKMKGEDGNPGAVPGAVPGGANEPLSASPGTLNLLGGDRCDSHIPLKMKGPALLSTGPHRSALTRATGVEPATSGATVRCSNQLSYAPNTPVYTADGAEGKGEKARKWRANGRPPAYTLPGRGDGAILANPKADSPPRPLAKARTPAKIG